MAVHCSWELKKKKKIDFLFSIQFKIIFVLFFFYSFILQIVLSEDKTFFLKLSPLCLTFSQNLLSSSLSQTLTSLSHHCRLDSILNVTGPPKLDVTDPPANPLCQTPKPPIHTSNPRLWSTIDPRLWPILAFSVALNSLKCILSNSHSKLSPLYPAAADPHLRSTPPTRLAFKWVVSVFFIYMLGIFDLGMCVYL